MRTLIIPLPYFLYCSKNKANLNYQKLVANFSLNNIPLQLIHRTQQVRRKKLPAIT